LPSSSAHWIHKRVSKGYTQAVPLKTKDAGLRLRVERDVRQQFVEACRSDGKSAAQVLREYMRDYIARNRAAAQRELFLEVKTPTVTAPRQSEVRVHSTAPGTARKPKRDRNVRHPE